MTFLAAKALGLDHGDTLQPDFVQRFLHFVEFERLDDRFDLFHLVQRQAFGPRPPLFRADSAMFCHVRTAQMRASQRADDTYLA
jgi:hypothetical protein